MAFPHADHLVCRAPTAPPPGPWLARSDHKRRGQMVPATRGADLHHVDVQFAEALFQRRQLPGGPDPPGVHAKLITVGVRDVDQGFVAADRTAPGGRLAMISSRPDQVWVSVTDVRRRHPARMQVSECRSPGERIVDNRPWTHGKDGTPDAATRQTVRTDAPRAPENPPNTVCHGPSRHDPTISPFRTRHPLLPWILRSGILDVSKRYV